MKRQKVTKDASSLCKLRAGVGYPSTRAQHINERKSKDV